MTPSRSDTKIGRFYNIPVPDGTAKLPSVTNILGVVGKPALVAWAGNVEREACIQAAADFYEDAAAVQKMSRPAYILSLTERIGRVRASSKLLAKAAEIGTQAHARVEWDLRKRLDQKVGPEPQVSEKALWAFMAWDDWSRSVALRPVHVEQTVYSLEYGYAGTLDLFAYVEDVPTVLDWKTGKAVYPVESFMQNAAYRHALREMGHGDPRRGLIVRLPKIDTDPQFEVVKVDERTRDLAELSSADAAEDWLFEKFLATKKLWGWNAVNEQEYHRKRDAARVGSEPRTEGA